MLSTLSLLLLAALPFAAADVSVVSPGAGSVLPVAGGITVTIGDNGVAPAFGDIATVQVFIIAGGNTADTSMTVYTLPVAEAPVGSIPLTGLTAAQIPSGSIASSYYVKVVAVAKAGGQTINYSQRFGISGGLLAVSSAAVKAAIAAPPAAVPANTPLGNANAPAAGATGPQITGYQGPPNPHPTGSWLPYSEQSNLATKSAPQQGKPGPSITQTNLAPLYPPTPWVVFSSMRPPPPQVTTNTFGGAITVASRENTAAAAAQPSEVDHMEKWLNRWKD